MDLLPGVQGVTCSRFLLAFAFCFEGGIACDVDPLLPVSVDVVVAADGFDLVFFDLQVKGAARLGLSAVKGRVGVGYDADLLLLDPGSLAIDCVWSRGQQMVSGGVPLAFGMFEGGSRS